MAIAALLSALVLAAQPPCENTALTVDVAPAEADVLDRASLARNVRASVGWRLRSDEAALGRLVELRVREGEVRASDGRRFGWRWAGEPRRPGAFQSLCGVAAPPAGVAAVAPLEVPRIRGYRYAGSQRMQGSAFKAVGLWEAVEGSAESLVVVFDPAVRSMRAPYAVLVRTTQALAAVSADATPRTATIRLAAVTRAPPGTPVHLLEWSWKDGSAYGLPLD